MSSWWGEQCPARGPALSHAHWDKCTDESHPGEDSGHMRFQCCHCRGLDPGARATVQGPEVQPPIDVTARLIALGLMPAIYSEDEPHQDDDIIEPKMVTGDGPQGSPFGPGRGPITPRFEARLLSYDRYVQRRGELP